MTAAVSIEIPEELYKRIEQVALRSGQSFETAFLESMSFLYTTIPLGDTERVLQEMAALSDVKLWAIVYQRLTPQTQEQFHLLLQKGNQGLLSATEKFELEELIQLHDYQVLLRSEALLLLKQRGYDLDGYFNSNIPT